MQPLAMQAEPLATQATAAGSRRVAGNVIDGMFRTPVAGATVTVYVASGPPITTTTDNNGSFALDLDAAPVAVEVHGPVPRGGFQGFETWVAGGSALAENAAGLRVELVHRLINPGRLTVISRDGSRSLCRAFQPNQLYDRYDIVPGQCGVAKPPR